MGAYQRGRGREMYSRVRKKRSRAGTFGQTASGARPGEVMMGTATKPKCKARNYKSESITGRHSMV